MRIDSDKCVGCKACVPYCPVLCIKAEEKAVSIDEDECVECGVCFRADVCPTGALFMPKESFEYPRAIRMQFSDPGVQHPNFKSWGRGTEEAKTNDVTGKFGRGEYGLLLEFGRPGTGTRLSEIEKVTKVVRSMNFDIMEDNPLYGLLAEDMSGSFKPEYVNEKILSGILEFRFEENELEEALKKLLPLLDDLDTVVSVGLVTRFADDSSIPVIDKLKNIGLIVRPNAKINVGLGRPVIER
ncbi:(4Fe-4S)-binding protein [Synergistales bacterium]|nr:(4Fe-4S)-binding protein [Synergistales bacterium]